MRLRTITAVLLLLSLYFVMAIAAEVYIDDFVKPRSLYASLLLSTFLTSTIALFITIEVPA
jgi:hypothetical protein